MITLKARKLEAKFPKLMVGTPNGTILLVSGPGRETRSLKGTVLSSNYWPIGHYSEEWDAAQFIDHNDEVVLVNS